MQQHAALKTKAPTDQRPPQLTTAAAASSPAAGTLTGAFIWLIVGLTSSAVAIVIVLSDPYLRSGLTDHWLGILVGQVFLVVGIEKASRAGASPLVALALFFILTLTMGLVLGTIMTALIATGGVSGVAMALMGAASVFIAAATYGGVTHRDLTTVGGVLFMGLFGLIGVVLVHMIFFPDAEFLSLVIGAAGVAIFTGFTAFDVQRIKNGEMDGVDGETGAVLGALALYLDFTGLVIYLLSFFGEE